MINVLRGKLRVCMRVCIRDTKEQFLLADKREKKETFASGIPHRRIIYSCQKPQLAKLNRNSSFHLIFNAHFYITIFSTCISTSLRENLTFLKRNLLFISNYKHSTFQ